MYQCGKSSQSELPVTESYQDVNKNNDQLAQDLSGEDLKKIKDNTGPDDEIYRIKVELNMVSEYKKSYWSFLKNTWIPWIVITITGILMVVFSTQLDFLVKWSL